MTKNKQFVHFLLIGLTFSGCYAPINRQFEDVSMITVSELNEHISFLASDSLKGRKPGTKEGRIAAEYIADNIEQLGLIPMGENGFQYFEVVTSVKLSEKNHAVFTGDTLFLHDAYTPLAFSSNSSLSAEIAFAGYGFDFTTDK